MLREIASEQAYADRAYARLEAVRAAAHRDATRAMGAQERGFAARAERESLVVARASRAAHLDVGDEALVLGRIDHADGTRIYVGRVGVTDDARTPLVVDWRAPAAEAFYRATGAHPMGVVRRRHFLSRGREIVHLDDELLDASSRRVRDLVLVGEAALLRAVERSRSGRMRDIVATIQAEQDEIIRAPHDGVLVVQGGPGTGKTAVALHRAAYLLYTHRDRLERQGVLLVGPSAVFLRYVEHVLPSLGEHAVTLATCAELVDGIAAMAMDNPDVERLKGDAGMVDVLRRAIAYRQRPLDAPVKALYDGELLVLTPKDTARIVREVRRAAATHNAGRPLVARRVLDLLADRYLTELRASARAGARSRRLDARLSDEERGELYEALLDDRRVRAALDAMWPALTPAQLLAGLYVSEEWRARGCIPGAWTPADVALLDEAAVLLGPLAARRRTGPTIDEEERWMIERMLDDLAEFDPIIRAERDTFAERYVGARASLDEDGDARVARRTFGHVVVDEAQDVSPMQWRMLARRCPSSSMTVVGDLGQASHAGGSWDDVAAHVGCAPRVAELTINYRTPAEVMDAAACVLAHAAPDVRPPRSVRHAGVPPVVHCARNLPAAAARVARAERRALEDGTLAILAPAGLVESIRDRVGAPADAQAALDAPIAVLPVRAAKGLEFDVVLVVEPAHIAAESGYGALYVALTRPTQRLVLIHAEPLPAELDGLQHAVPEPALVP
jgi:DNA helicase IV